MIERAIELEGTVTGEHGVGLVKRDYLPHELGETTVDAMRKVCLLCPNDLCDLDADSFIQLKLAFDPLCLLNCDKVVRIQKPKPGEVEDW